MTPTNLTPAQMAMIQNGLYSQALDQMDGIPSRTSTPLSLTSEETEEKADEVKNPSWP